MEQPKIRLLYVDDNKVDLYGVARLVKQQDLPYEAVYVESASEFKERLKSETFDVVLLDFMLNEGTAFDLFDHVPQGTAIVIITGSGNEEVAVKAMKLGASDYLIKDGEGHWLKTVPITIQNAIKSRDAELALKKAHEELEHKVAERTADLLEANAKLLKEIDQRKSAEEALKRSEERFRSLTETTSEWIWEMTPDGVITYANPRVEELLGYKAAEVIGKNRCHFMVAESASRVREEWKRVVQSRLAFRGLVTHNLHRNGRTVILEAGGVPFFDVAGEVAGYRGIDMDITERNKAEQLLIRSERIKAVADLAAGVAHNFNNLLQIVVSGLESALISIEDGDTAFASTAIKQVLESSRFGSKTVRSLQVFAQSDAEPQPESGASFSLSHVTGEATEVSWPWLKAAHDRSGINITLETDFLDPCFVMGQENEIFEVVVNLIKNAVEALPDGGAIAISTHELDGQAALTVRDNGVGIAKENLARVFEPFFTTKLSGGTGMGLASSLGIVKKQGGTITVSSAPGRGSEFLVQLPLAAPPPPSSKPAEPWSEFDWRLNILLVDDQPEIANLLNEGLRARHQKVFTAYSGESALQILKSQDIDLIVSDLGMPDMNGLQLAQAVKELSDTKGIPKPLFILLTGWDKDVVEQNRWEGLGLEAVIRKPATMGKILSTTSRLMQARDRK